MTPSHDGPPEPPERHSRHRRECTGVTRPENALSPDTLAVVAGRPPATTGAPVNPAIQLSSTFHASPFPHGTPAPPTTGTCAEAVYGRWDNSTWESLEAALGTLEEGRGLAFASGMGAVAAALSLVPRGGTVLAPRAAYSGTRALLGELTATGAVQLREVDIDDTDAVARSVAGVDLVWAESPTNPLLEVADLPGVVDLAHRAGALVVVDNTLATPLLQRPLRHGADLVVHSATKYLSGHSDVLLGATVTARDDLHEQLLSRRTLHGAVPGPVEAWLVLRGLRTLHLRVARAGRSATELARRLVGHPAVERVRHPGLADDPGHERAAALLDGFGGIIGVEVRGGASAAERVAAAVRLWVHATSLGGVESSLERRRRHSAETDVVPENLLRLSVGVEDVDDLWRDLDRALHAALRPAPDPRD